MELPDKSPAAQEQAKLASKQSHTKEDKVHPSACAHSLCRLLCYIPKHAYTQYRPLLVRIIRDSMRVCNMNCAFFTRPLYGLQDCQGHMRQSFVVSPLAF